MTYAQLKIVNTLLAKLQLQPQKENILLGISNGRTTSLKQLTHEEAVQLIRYLKSQDADEEACKKMRGKILAMAFEIGYTKVNNKGKRVTDVERLDKSWMLQYSYLKKKFYSYTYNELPKLVSQFSSMYNYVLKNVQTKQS